MHPAIARLAAAVAAVLAVRQWWQCTDPERTPMCSVCWRPVTFAAVRRGDHRCAHCVAAGRHPS